ncbi:hypothetical protein DFH06DRAFT_1121556 [Mycena polygramma]|nr:hypothetical protein DFH06DRAFT_1121556 [Mycena polygramma]
MSKFAQDLAFSDISQDLVQIPYCNAKMRVLSNKDHHTPHHLSTYLIQRAGDCAEASRPFWQWEGSGGQRRHPRSMRFSGTDTPASRRRKDRVVCARTTRLEELRRKRQAVSGQCKSGERSRKCISESPWSAPLRLPFLVRKSSKHQVRAAWASQLQSSGIASGAGVRSTSIKPGSKAFAANGYSLVTLVERGIPRDRTCGRRRCREQASVKLIQKERTENDNESVRLLFPSVSFRFLLPLFLSSSLPLLSICHPVPPRRKGMYDAAVEGLSVCEASDDATQTHGDDARRGVRRELPSQCERERECCEGEIVADVAMVWRETEKVFGEWCERGTRKEDAVNVLPGLHKESQRGGSRERDSSAMPMRKRGLKKWAVLKNRERGVGTVVVDPPSIAPEHLLPTLHSVKVQSRPDSSSPPSPPTCSSYRTASHVGTDVRPRFNQVNEARMRARGVQEERGGEDGAALVQGGVRHGRGEGCTRSGERGRGGQGGREAPLWWGEDKGKNAPSEDPRTPRQQRHPTTRAGRTARRTTVQPCARPGMRAEGFEEGGGFRGGVEDECGRKAGGRCGETRGTPIKAPWNATERGHGGATTASFKICSHHFGECGVYIARRWTFEEALAGTKKFLKSLNGRLVVQPLQYNEI